MRVQEELDKSIGYLSTISAISELYGLQYPSEFTVGFCRDHVDMTRFVMGSEE